MLAEIPSRDRDEFITKDDLGEQLAVLPVEMHQLINRTLAALIGTMVGVAAVSVAAIGIIVSTLR